MSLQYTRNTKLNNKNISAVTVPFSPSFPSDLNIPAKMGIYEGCVAERCAREFFSPEPISRTGNYYPRYRITGLMETGTCHISYLARPLFEYSLPSKYGFSK